MLKVSSLTLLLLMMLPSGKTDIKVTDITLNESFREFTNLAIYMTRRFMSVKTNTLVISDKCAVICSVEQKHHTALLTNILSNLHEEFAVQLFLGHCNDQLWDYNIFIVDSHEAFISLRYTFPNTQHERFFNFFILLTASASREVERNQTLLKIFETSLSFDVRNVVVLSKPFEADYFTFHTYELSKEGNCQDEIEIREINRYENGTLQNQFLFPDHIKDFNGCYLNVTAQQIRPLLSFDGDVNNETHLLQTSRLSGVEGEILKLVAEALNFKIRLRFSKEKNFIRLLMDSTGLFRDLDRKRANIAIGGLSSTWANGGKYSSSHVYHATPYVFVVRTGLCFGPIRQLLNPFCPSTWTFLLIFFSISFVFTKAMQSRPKLSDLVFGPTNKKPLCTMFVVFFGNALPNTILPRKSFARFLLASWLLLSFELRNGYQGKMFDSLRFSNRIAVPKAISHLLEKDYTLLSSSYSDYYPRNKTIIMTSIGQRFNTLQTSSLRLTATALLDSLAYYNYLKYNSSKLTYVEEPIYSMQCVMYFQKHSIFRSSINRILKLIDNAGITSFIAKQNAYSSFQDINSASQFEIRLKNNNLKGVYFISGVMFCISIIIFVLELLTPKSRALRKVMEVLNSF